jgi:cardiolipin synthase
LKQIPNALTLLRLVLVPLIAARLLERDYEAALWLLLACAATDLADGGLARRLHCESRFGSVADPVADKLTVLTVTGLLAVQQWLPLWFAGLVLSRDLIIVGGALAYHLRCGHVDMAPTRLSKANTALQLALLCATLLHAADILSAGWWRGALLWATAATVLASGTQYVLLWSRKALQDGDQAAR